MRFLRWLHGAFLLLGVSGLYLAYTSAPPEQAGFLMLAALAAVAPVLFRILLRWIFPWHEQRRLQHSLASLLQASEETQRQGLLSITKSLLSLHRLLSQEGVLLHALSGCVLTAVLLFAWIWPESAKTPALAPRPHSPTLPQSATRPSPLPTAVDHAIPPALPPSLVTAPAHHPAIATPTALPTTSPTPPRRRRLVATPPEPPSLTPAGVPPLGFQSPASPPPSLTPSLVAPASPLMAPRGTS